MDANLVTVLLADDHELVAAELRRLLALECSVVGVVRDGNALVSAAETLAPSVIVSDVAMPGLDGLSAAAAILSRNPDARIVFVSELDEPSIVRRAFALGALGYVLKRHAGEDLLPAVRAASAGRIYRQPASAPERPESL